ncbi:RidA family protein [Aristophania vespae]|uniref:RidA family protein n=1 Tax=Aristophania vespae TaxID=2697033 RepID=A0A6P1NBQ6_9PROT|nr:RidA family protein [Aristophania vespae]QHI94953.1 RidA family protein [Aristophania vespae]UMM64118.1 hypothetical protein DM15PD_11030 [Aristophania vespae]
MSRIIRTETNSIVSKAVEYHGFIFTQGVVSNDLTLNIEGQVKNIFQQLDDVLEIHGTDNSRILQAQIWLKNINDRDVFNKLWEKWLPANQAPARACVQATLADERILVEVMLTTTK